ncbi:MAG: hypothetical protein J1E16_02490 [Muribaculaceae bacterium]|nr:hypothetical protein [Muribaculaceae bacterium]
MKDLRRYLQLVSISGVIFTMTSCVNTETLEPQPIPITSNKIVLNLSAPESISTRATDDFKLRYVAKIYNGSWKNLNTTKYSARQELVEGSAGPAGKENQMVFDVEANQSYVIFVFADYIPKEFVPSSEGYYNDYYYDTKSTKAGATGVNLLGNPGNLPVNDNDYNVTSDFFNNDNYDCFAGYVDIGEKGEEKIEKSIALDRIVSKVRVLDTTGRGGNLNVNVSEVSYVNHFDLINDGGGSAKTSSISHNLGSINLSGGEEDEILYFYTFSSKSTEGGYQPSLKFSLTVSNNDNFDGSNNSASFTINKIPVKKNNITKVKGKFLHSLYSQDVTEGDVHKGAIFLNVSVSNTDWLSSESEWSSK